MTEKNIKIIPLIPKPIHKEYCDKYKERLEMLRSVPPNEVFHTYETIKWLRRSQSKTAIKKSINSLIKKPQIELKQSRSFTAPKKQKIRIVINPKYFFTKGTFEKILKLKELFLDFDKDGNRKMEIEEMTAMFNINNVHATTEDIKQLLFKNKNTQKLFLNFYQFVQFSLGNDYDFRLFMREQRKNQILQPGETNYLPMNFNLLLDYFLTKGEERRSVAKITNSINIIDDIIINNKTKIENIDAFIRMNSEIKINNIMDEFSKLFSLTTNGTPEEFQAKRKRTKKRTSIAMIKCNGAFSNAIKENMIAQEKPRVLKLPKLVKHKENILIYKKINHYHNSKFDISKENTRVNTVV